MNGGSLVLALIMTSLTILAYKREISEFMDCYEGGKPTHKDSLQTLLNKTRICCEYQKHTIKWRKCYLLSMTVVVLLFLIVFSRFPSPREFIVSFMLVFTLSYLSFFLLNDPQSSLAYSYGNECIILIEQRLKKSMSDY